MNWNDILFTTIGIILTAVITWLGNKLSALLTSHIKDAKALKYTRDITQIVLDGVKATYQSYVEGLKGTDAWTKGAQKKALSMALNTIKSQLSDELIKFIAENFGDVERWLTGKIESSLYDLKKI